MNLPQSGVIVGALLAGFVIWLVMQGKLGAYWSLLLGGGTSASATTPPAPSGSSSSVVPNILRSLPIPGAQVITPLIFGN